MASVLPPPLACPLDLPFGESSYMRSRSSCADETSTIRRHVLRSNSPASYGTVSSLPSGLLGTQKENSPLSGSASSLLNFKLFDSYSTGAAPRRSWSWAVPGEPSNLTPRHPTAFTIDDTLIPNDTPDSEGEDQLTVLHLSNPDTSSTSSEPAPSIELEDASSSSVDLLGVGEEAGHSSRPTTPQQAGSDDDGTSALDDEVKEGQTSPFKRWLRVLRKRNQPQAPLHAPEQRWVLDDFNNGANQPLRKQILSPRRHRKTPSSVSSVAIVAAVKTASITLASFSMYPKSKRSHQTSYLRRETSSQNVTPTRGSLDSISAAAGPVMDDGTWTRSVQRQRIVEEIVSSEESYIRDMRTLIDVYLTVLPKNGQDRRTIYKSVGQILQLHEELIAQLQAILKIAEPPVDKASKPRRGFSRHVRWHSIDGAPHNFNLKSRLDRLTRHSIDTSRPSLIHSKAFMADTKLVMDITKVFERFMQRFMVYEAYAAYNNLFGECSSSLRMSATWLNTEKGIEALSSLTTAAVNRESDNHKALTFADLIVKPIQRICKYPLFFNDLCKYTPACDDPVTHAELQKLLSKLQGLVEEINQASSNPSIRKQIEISWLLQSRLDFGNTIITNATIFQKLGRVLLCGVLHVTFTTNDRVQGQYMISILYRSMLILATLNKTPNSYSIDMSIPLVNASIDTTDNGKGLQCHTAQFSWKITFDIERRQHEIIISACSEREEEIWTSHLRSRISAETTDFSEGRVDMVDSMFLAKPHPDMKAIGPAFGPFTNFSRRLSIQRAATLGPRSNVQQVILKNTEAQKYTTSGSTSMSVMRSQSHMSSNHIPTLAPRRAERIKLENTISDVWTKTVLPYPGMGTKRGDNPIRASANSVMRKLSMASIASNFSKRSMSYSTLSGAVQRAAGGSAAGDDGYASSSGQSTTRTIRPKKAPIKRKRPVLVDFHNTPTAFLPEDFELNVKTSSNMNRRSRKLAARLSAGSDTPPPVSASRPTTACSKKTENQPRPVVVSKADTIRSMMALTFDSVVDCAAFEESIPCHQRTASHDLTAFDTADITAVLDRPATSSGEESMRRRTPKARKGFFRFFG
ncbi:hypothetical protein BT63DRAFT_456161 [Microthyrium microscopicum]|uniref:DH domain-containing protein n=1 Tax=Microthyrium microscopicum TaxID=703497 RepID=A0A6A6U8D0_9PEZI|nr:hypothetical protein BT63DRAFT_456161 [Microthyrium microscopicum]